MILNDLRPQAVFAYFSQICAIPHGSYHTKAISDYCTAFAREHNLDFLQDEHDNVIIFKAGSTGYEESDPVIIQGHLDMVCEKENGVDFDFLQDSLNLHVEGNRLFAEGTTLGGDDGIAVAYALALLADENIAHPPLEVVFTADEEVGMLGAAALDCSGLRGRMMLNIDSEEEGSLLAGCAGGRTVTGKIPVVRQKKAGFAAELTVQGLTGGHSGAEIDKGRANANKLLGRALYQLDKKIPFDLLSVFGGEKDNAIPRKAKAVLCLENQEDFSRLKEEADKLQTVFAREYGQTEPALSVTAQMHSRESAGEKEECLVFDGKSKARVIAALFCLPDGVERMSTQVTGMVQTSLNLGIMRTKDIDADFELLIRSNLDSEKEALCDKVEALFAQFGGTLAVQGDYPAWAYREDSRLREVMTQVYLAQYGKNPNVLTMHAGVECGVFAQKLSGLDCVSFGPNIADIHTPRETLDIESVARTWDFLLEVLRQLK